MIQRNDLLAFNFYKKEKFTGSFKGMRYRVEKTTNEEEESFFLVTTWPGAYNYDSTDEQLRKEKNFPFEENSLTEIADYLNQIYAADKDNWPTRIY